jgi:1-acyl-sn-glycerol-3-phosphate acyltransferase
MIVLRSLLFSVAFFGGTFFLSVAGTLIAPFAPATLPRFTVAYARLGIWAARVLCGIRLEVTGWENLLDTFVWFTLVPRCCYVMKRELLRIPLMGRLIRATGMIAVDRDGGGRTIRILVKEGRRAAAEGRQIVIFPEGTRADPGEMLPLQPGVAALAAGTGLPVMKRELLRIPLMGRLIRATGMIAVDRDHPGAHRLRPALGPARLL